MTMASVMYMFSRNQLLPFIMYKCFRMDIAIVAKCPSRNMDVTVTSLNLMVEETIR